MTGSQVRKPIVWVGGSREDLSAFPRPIKVKLGFAGIMRAGARATDEAKRGGTAPRIERSSGNVFEDLGLPDSAALLAKAELVSRICDIIAKRGLTQAQAAKILGVN